MNKKQYFVILLFALSIVKIQATPDRARYVIDTLIGLKGNNIVVHQIIFDNMQTYQGGFTEEYVVEKFMDKGETLVIKQFKVTENKTVEEILLENYSGRIKRIFPVMEYGDNFYNEAVEQWNVKEHIPKELKNSRILRVTDVYYHDDYDYLTVDLHEGVNTYRKVIMIRR